MSNTSTGERRWLPPLLPPLLLLMLLLLPSRAMASTEPEHAQRFQRLKPGPGGLWSEPMPAWPPEAEGHPHWRDSGIPEDRASLPHVQVMPVFPRPKPEPAGPWSKPEPAVPEPGQVPPVLPWPKLEPVPWLKPEASGVPQPAVPTGLDMPLLQKLASDLSGNEAISPFVMSSLMTQVLLGAVGSTRDEMTPVLGLVDSGTGVAMDYLSGYQSAIDALSSLSTENLTVTIFNGMYVRPDFHVLRNYSETLRQVYRSEAKPITSPEQAAADINAAVSNVTHGRIPQLVEAGQLEDVLMVLVSALYFKALWKHPFEADRRLTSFLTASGERSLRMMSLPRPVELMHVKRTTFEAVALPYSEEDFCMLLVRPAERSMSSARSLLDNLNTLNITEIVNSMRKRRMLVSMPKFKVEAEYELKDTLEALGIRKIFQGNADFSGLSRERGVYVKDVIHKVFIEVTEEGTEAAGAGAAFFTKSMPMTFVVDRPFVAVVYDRRQGLNLFSAFITSPSSDADSAEGPSSAGEAHTSAQHGPQRRRPGPLDIPYRHGGGPRRRPAPLDISSRFSGPQVERNQF